MAKRRILVVGGNNRRNVPTWLNAAFIVEHFEGDAGDAATPRESPPDAVVVLSSWISHKHFHDAREIAEKSGAPLILSPGGWSAALQSAAEHGIDWFLRDIEATKSSVQAEEAQEVEAVVENAWKEAYSREWARAQALERRYSKDRIKFAEAQERIAKAARREQAAERVIQEVREAAKQQREHLDIRMSEVRLIAEEIKARNERTTQCLSSHFAQLRELLEKAAASEQLLLQTASLLRDTKRSIEESMKALETSLAQSDQATQPIVQPSLTQEPATA